MTDDPPLPNSASPRLPASITTRAAHLTWGNGAILVLVAVVAVLVYAYLAGAFHSEFDPLGDELFRRACATEIGLGITAVVLGIVAVVRRSGRWRGAIALILGVGIALVSLALASLTERWDSRPAPGRYEGWTPPAHASCALVEGSGGFLFSHGKVFVCVGPARRTYFCREEYGSKLGSGWFDPNSPADCDAYARYARAHEDLPALAAPPS
jgi:hypothetical protein